MPPKRRRPKKGESRRDAALDAMIPYGFPTKLVRTTINSLLKVYGGNEGWVFIEEASYMLLIETIIEKQANPSPEDDLNHLIEANPDGPNEVKPAGCSNSALLACSNSHTSDYTPLTNQAMDIESSASGTGDQFPINGVDTVPATTEIGSELPSEPANQPLGYQVQRRIEAASETPINVVDTIQGRRRIKATSETPIKAEEESDYQSRRRIEAASETPIMAEIESSYQGIKRIEAASETLRKAEKESGCQGRRRRRIEAASETLQKEEKELGHQGRRRFEATSETLRESGYPGRRRIEAPSEPLWQAETESGYQGRKRMEAASETPIKKEIESGYQGRKGIEAVSETLWKAEKESGYQGRRRIEGASETLWKAEKESGIQGRRRIEAASETLWKAEKESDYQGRRRFEVASETPIKVEMESGYQGRIESASETPIRAEIESEFKPVEKLALGENHVSKSPKVETGVGDKRYKPCFGWITNDDEEEAVELIQLPPAPWLRFSYARGNNGIN